MRLGFILILCLLYAGLNVTGTALIKQGIAGNTLNGLREYFEFFFRYKVLFGIFLNFCSMLVIVKALAMEKFTYVFPVAIGINFALTALAGYFVFSERLSALSFTGLVLILAGITLMSAANQ